VILKGLAKYKIKVSQIFKTSLNSWINLARKKQYVSKTKIPCNKLPVIRFFLTIFCFFTKKPDPVLNGTGLPKNNRPKPWKYNVVRESN